MPFPRPLLLLLLLLHALASRGQRPDTIETITLNGPAPSWPLLASLSTLPQHQPADDSLLRLAYRRHHVRTVTLLEVREKNRLDTIEYTELNQQGQLTLYRPAFGQTYRQRYNRRQQLLEKTVYPTPGFGLFVQVTYDPATRITTTRIGPSLGQLAPMQVVRSRQVPDGATELEAFLYPGPLHPADAPRRLVTRHLRVGRDTSRLDVVGYDAAGQVIAYESFYQLGSQQHRTEEGQVYFGAPGAAASAQWLASQRTHGRYVPLTRQVFDAHGYLVRRVFIPQPPADREPPTTQKNTFQGASITISPLADTTSVRYVRTAQGYLLREEYAFAVPDAQDPGKKRRELSFTEYTYAPDGLRQTKAGSLAARYVYRYTYY